MIDNLLPRTQLLSAFLGHWSQGDRLLVESVTGHEGISQGYRYETMSLYNRYMQKAHVGAVKLLGYFRYFAFSLAFMWSGHGYALEPGADTAKWTPATDALACPSREFPEFLKAFAESKEIQMAFTRYPLKKQHLDIDVGLEPKPILRSLSKSQVEFPLIPDAIGRKGGNLDIWVDELSEKHAEVTLRKRDGDLHSIGSRLNTVRLSNLSRRTSMLTC